MQDNQENSPFLFRLLSSYILFLFSVQVITIGISLAHVRISTWLARGILCISIAVALIFLISSKGDIKILILYQKTATMAIPIPGIPGDCLYDLFDPLGSRNRFTRFIF